MIVLDTHIWLWWVNNDTDKLDSTRKEQIESSDIVAVSASSTPAQVEISALKTFGSSGIGMGKRS
jgi:PIN domain nuclease of toxin-antitoxin system